MTPDDKRRLAAIRQQHTREIDEPYHQKVKHFAWIDMDTVLRLLDEATAERDDFRAGFETVERQCRDAGRELRACKAERDAAMAALRPFAIAADDLDEKTRDNSEVWEMPAAMGIEAKDLRNARAVLAAHSAATKPADPIEK